MTSEPTRSGREEVLTAPPTPTLDALADQGVLFRNVHGLRRSARPPAPR